MNVVKEYESYGYRIWEMDDGTFHLIQDDGTPMVCHQKGGAEIMAYILSLRAMLEKKRLRDKVSGFMMGLSSGVVISVLLMLVV